MSASSTSSTASPTESDSSKDRFGGGTSSSNLYLVTFLATLFLLLFVSCGFVLRSYLLRRRLNHSRNLAAAAGLHLTPRAPGSRKKRFSVKPSFFETWLTPGGQRWHQMMPLAAQPILIKRRAKEKDGPTPPSPLPDQPQQPDSLFKSMMGNLRHAAPNNTHAPTPPSEKPVTMRVFKEMIQVTVLIAMPSSLRPNRYSIMKSTSSLLSQDDDDELNSIPDLVVGVCRSHSKPSPSDP